MNYISLALTIDQGKKHTYKITSFICVTLCGNVLLIEINFNLRLESSVLAYLLFLTLSFISGNMHRR